MRALKQLWRGLLLVLALIFAALYVLYEIFDDLTSTGQKPPRRR